MKAARSLTVGSVPLHIMRLAAPLILGNILQQFYNTIDALVIGRYAGYLEFAAIGVSASVMNLFLFAIVGACTGISVIFAQLYGAGDLAAFRNEHFLTVLFGLVFTAILCIFGILCLPLILRLIALPSELTEPACAYLRIVFLGLPAAFLYNLYSGLLRAVGRTYAVLLILASAVGVNLRLDLYFISVLELGIRGAAWATVLAQILSVLLCLLYLRLTAPSLFFHRTDCRLNRPLLVRTAHYSFVTGFHQAGLYIGKLLVQGAVNSAGTPSISAYTAATRIEGFANSFGDSGCAATSVVVAQNLGAREKRRVRKCFSASLFLMLALGLFCSLLMYFFSGAASAFMLGTAAGSAYESAAGYLRTISLFYVLCFTGNTFAGYFDGCGKVSVPFIGALGHISLRALLSWLLIPHLGLNAVAIATGIGWFLANLFWSLAYLRQALHRASPAGNAGKGRPSK